MSVDHDKCHRNIYINSGNGPLISAIMFAFGIFGNVAALVILKICRRRKSNKEVARRRALFQILITCLVATDLAGTCFVTPLVQLAYAWNTTLYAMSNVPNMTDSNVTDSGVVCKYFGFSMTFFSLATMLLLLMMAVERCVGIGYPYFYGRHVTRKCAYVSVPLAFLSCLVFCMLPLVGFGSYVQYCPGTWCFIDMKPEEKDNQAYSYLYATVMLVLVLSITLCNGLVVYQLFRMYQRRNRLGSVGKTMAGSQRRTVSMAEEVEHLVLLVFMTIIFIFCTLPLVIRVYLNSEEEESHLKDRTALRFLSSNSIVDPWVFILLSPSVLHFLWVSLCRASRTSVVKKTLVKENSANSEARTRNEQLDISTAAV